MHIKLRIHHLLRSICWWLLLSGLVLRAADRPNFVFFLSDDQTKADYGCYGLPLNLTPITDALAKEGLVFDRMFTAEAICAPSRSALFTGQYPIRNGCFMNHMPVRDGTRTIYDALKPLGYDVSLIGKVHVKPAKVFRWSTPTTAQNVQEMPMDAIESFLKTHADKPFCLFLTSHLPHPPFPPDPNFPRDQVIRHPYQSAGAARELPGYYDNIALKEQELKTVLVLLERYGLKDNTVFIYSSDHGAGAEAKFTVYDRGLNVPFIVRWPGRIKPGRTDALTSYTDLLPTLVELAGGKPPADLDGKSFAPVLRDPAARHHQYVFGVMTQQGVLDPHVFPRRSVRDDRFHYIFNFNTLERIRRDEAAGREINPFYRLGAAKHPDTPEEELYDTQTDPWEMRNLAGDLIYSKAKEKLKAVLFSWMQEQNDFLREGGDIPFLRSTNPVDQSVANYVCPPELVGSIKNFVDPYELTKRK